MVILVSRRRCSIALPLFLSLLLVGVFYTPASADGGAPQLAYVAGAAQGIGVIDIAQKRVTSVIATAKNPGTVLLSPDGQMLYVTQPVPGRVMVLLAKTGKTLCTKNLPGQPSLLALSLNATVLYAAGQGDSRVYALNPTTCALQRTFETHEAVYGLAVAASTAIDATPSTPNQLWVTGTNSLSIFTVDGVVLGSVPIAGGPQHISIPGGFTAYISTRQGTVVAVDLNTRRVIRTLLTGGEFGPMDYDAITGEVYVPDLRHNQLDVLTPVVVNASSGLHEPARIFHLDHTPQSVAITSDGQLGFVALSNGQVLMLDIPGRSVVSNIKVGGTPRFIITGLYPPTDSALTTSRQTTKPSVKSVNYLFIGLILLVGVFLLGMSWLLWRAYRKRLHHPHSIHKDVS
jgi:DNA-binding beta-propeller fold protein YncE